MRCILFFASLLLFSCGGTQAPLSPRQRVISCFSQQAAIYPNEARVQWFKNSKVATLTTLPQVDGEFGPTYPCAIQSPTEGFVHGYCYTPPQVKGGLVCYEDKHVECRVLKGTYVDIVGSGDLFCKWVLPTGEVLSCNGAGDHCEEQ